MRQTLHGPGSSPQDRRQMPRIELKHGSAKVDSKTYRLKNISTTGFLLQPYRGDMVPRQRVYLKLIIMVNGQEREFAVDAFVVRVVGDSLAARFFSLRPDARRVIESFQRHLPTAAP